MSRNQTMSRNQKRRSAVVLVCVLACLAVVSAILLMTCKSAIAARRETKLRVQLQQTELLLDAGILRAAEQLRNSDDYAGETWKPTQAFSNYESPIVEIAINVQPDRDGNPLRNITVVAKLTGEQTTQRSHQFTK